MAVTAEDMEFVRDIASTGCHFIAFRVPDPKAPPEIQEQQRQLIEECDSVILTVANIGMALELGQDADEEYLPAIDLPEGTPKKRPEADVDNAILFAQMFVGFCNAAEKGQVNARNLRFPKAIREGQHDQAVPGSGAGPERADTVCPV